MIAAFLAALKKEDTSVMGYALPVIRKK